MMINILEVFGEFELTVAEKKTESLVMHVREMQNPPPPSSLTIEVAG